MKDELDLFESSTEEEEESSVQTIANMVVDWSANQADKDWSYLLINYTILKTLTPYLSTLKNYKLTP